MNCESIVWKPCSFDFVRPALRYVTIIPYISITHSLFISDKEIMFSAALVCFCIFFPFISHEQTAMKFYEGGWGDKRNRGLNFKFGCDMVHHADCPIRNPAITKQIMRVF